MTLSATPSPETITVYNSFAELREALRDPDSALHIPRQDTSIVRVGNERYLVSHRTRTVSPLDEISISGRFLRALRRIFVEHRFRSTAFYIRHKVFFTSGRVKPSRLTLFTPGNTPADDIDGVSAALSATPDPAEACQTAFRYLQSGMMDRCARLISNHPTLLVMTPDNKSGDSAAVTLLEQVCRRGDSKLIQMVLGLPESRSVFLVSGSPLLSILAQREGMMRPVVEAGLDPEIFRSLDSNGLSLLHRAIQTGNYLNVVALIEHEPELFRVADSSGTLPVEMVLQQNRFSLMAKETLLDQVTPGAMMVPVG